MTIEFGWPPGALSTIAMAAWGGAIWGTGSWPTAEEAATVRGCVLTVNARDSGIEWAKAAPPEPEPEGASTNPLAREEVRLGKKLAVKAADMAITIMIA
jgi:hypothetical protein